MKIWKKIGKAIKMGKRIYQIKGGYFVMKKLLFCFILGLSVFTTACGGWSKPSSSSNNDKPIAESNKNKGDKDAPVAELLVTNGF
mgnify:CR=1 FL=1